MGVRLVHHFRERPAASADQCQNTELGQKCVDGKCVCPEGSGLTTCGWGLMYCVDTNTDPYHCGGCGNLCAECANGTCAACQQHEMSCDGVCADPSGEANCGACGNACAPNERCVGETEFRCAACPAGQLQCNGDCTNVANDNRHCGACGKECEAGSNCVEGQCTKSVDSCCTGQRCGADGCVNMSNDNRHCGACGNKVSLELVELIQCGAGKNCVGGVCV